MIKEENAPRRLSISEMAQIHKISRQTLIYYDKIDLFKPAIVEENGYRFYSVEQIPILREICFLRSIDMPLDEIRKNNQLNKSKSTIELLTEQRNRIDDEINKLKRQKREIEKRLLLYKKSSDIEFSPYIQYFPERKLVYHEWNHNAKKTREEMHSALVKAWNDAGKYGILPTSLYGTLFEMQDVIDEKPLEHVKSCFIISNENAAIYPETITLKAGEYVCIQKFGMSYDISMLNAAIKWINEKGYELDGDVYDESLMDGSIYSSRNEPDFSELQIPVRSR